MNKDATILLRIGIHTTFEECQLSILLDEQSMTSEKMMTMTGEGSCLEMCPNALINWDYLQYGHLLLYMMTTVIDEGDDIHTIQSDNGNNEENYCIKQGEESIIMQPSLTTLQEPDLDLPSSKVALGNIPT